MGDDVENPSEVLTFKTEHSKASLIQTAANDLKRGQLFRHEQNGLPADQSRCYEVRDGLGLARPGRAFDDKILPAHRVNQGAVLRAVCINNQRGQFVFEFRCVNRMLFRVRNCVAFSALEKFRHERVCHC